MREIILDTETTGLDPKNGDRVVEIGCVEMVDLVRTERSFHKYINPERDMPEAAFKVHGLSADFLQTQPKFAEIVEEFVAFLGDAPLIIHNAAFDMSFLNMELTRAGYPALGSDRVVDTLLLARKKFPGQSNSLDSLCQRFGVDLSRRVKHGALLDSEILSDVYVELRGGKQTSLSLSEKIIRKAATTPKRDLWDARRGALDKSDRFAQMQVTWESVIAPNTKALWHKYSEN